MRRHYKEQPCRRTHPRLKGKHATGVVLSSILLTSKNALLKKLSAMHVRREGISLKCAVDTNTLSGINSSNVIVHSVFSYCHSYGSKAEFSYGEHTISVMGCLEAEVMLDDWRATAELFVVNTDTAMLGRDLFAALELQLLDGRIVTSPCCPINSADTTMKPEKLGCAQGFTHLVKERHLRNTTGTWTQHFSVWKQLDLSSFAYTTTKGYHTAYILSLGSQHGIQSLYLAQTSFERVKDLIINSPALTLFDPELHTIITTDASNHGLGAVLTQMHPDGSEKTVAFAPPRLMMFHYDIQYKPGRENVAADCSGPVLEDDVEVVALTSTLTAISADEFRTAETCNTLRAQFIALAHDTHQGTVRTKQRLRELHWYPGMDAQVETAIKSCITCQSHAKTAVVRTPPLQPVPLPNGAWDKLAIDIVGPFDMAPTDCRFAVTLVDYFSKWPEIAFMPQITSLAVIQFLSMIFSREGDPQELVSDHGSQFMSHEFEMFLRNRGIVHRTSFVYYPRANGEVEQFNHTLKHTLLTASLEGKGWKEFTRKFLQVYRSTPHSTTQCAPAELLHARQMRTKLHISGLQIPQHLHPPKMQNIVDREESRIQEMANFDYDCTMQPVSVAQPERQVRVRRAPAWTLDYVMN
ncbi:hypothetical protein H4Q32_018215 [Labeo rohita]|uniref:Gypsy retrotransposon integrase-like protein 1 n=1 Tax=Labeo rohita TaxID=84645 RepID=A0ABQ8LBR8_LABRO|nr:hypothetical protein H4Q32_018215 [Labeo rohita]